MFHKPHPTSLIIDQGITARLDDELKGSKADASVLDVVFGHSTKMPLQLPGSNDETQRSRNVSRRGDTASGCAGPTYR